MKILDRYLWRYFFRSFLFLSLVFGFLFAFFEFLSELDDVGQGSYTLLKALVYVLYTSGDRLFELLPIVSLLAGLSSLGSLADRNELLAMQAAGMSRRRMTLVLTMALVLILGLALILEETLFPEANDRAWLFRAKALSQRGITPYKEGFWAKEGHIFIKVEKILDNQLLSGIEIFSFDERGQLRRLIEAPLGRVENRHWVLWSAIKREFSTEQIREEGPKRIEIPAFLKTNQVEVLTLPSEYLSIRELWRYREVLEKGGQNVYRYSLLIWQKVAVPLTALVMLLLALTFVFAPRRERGSGFRFSLGALIGLFVYLGKEILSHVGLVFTVSAPVVALGPAGVVLLWTLWRLRKIG